MKASIEKTSVGFVISAGDITLMTTKVSDLARILAFLEQEPASAQAKAGKAEKSDKKSAKAVAKAGKTVSKPAVSNLQIVLAFMQANRGKKQISEVSEGTGLTMKQCADNLWRLWKAGKLKSSEKGVYSK